MPRYVCEPSIMREEVLPFQFVGLNSALLVFVTVLLVGCGLPAWAWNFQQAQIMSPWAQLVDTNNPLPEYPRPQLVRADWMNLNGIWQFQAGATNDPVPTNQVLGSEILVP